MDERHDRAYHSATVTTAVSAYAPRARRSQQQRDLVHDAGGVDGQRGSQRPGKHDSQHGGLVRSNQDDDNQDGRAGADRALEGGSQSGPPTPDAGRCGCDSAARVADQQHACAGEQPGRRSLVRRTRARSRHRRRRPGPPARLPVPGRSRRSGSSHATGGAGPRSWGSRRPMVRVRHPNVALRAAGGPTAALRSVTRVTAPTSIPSARAAVAPASATRVRPRPRPAAPPLSASPSWCCTP